MPFFCRAITSFYRRNVLRAAGKKPMRMKGTVRDGKTFSLHREDQNKAVLNPRGVKMLFSAKAMVLPPPIDSRDENSFSSSTWQQRDEFIYLCGVKCCCFLYASALPPSTAGLSEVSHFGCRRKIFQLKTKMLFAILQQFSTSFTNLNGETES